MNDTNLIDIALVAAMGTVIVAGLITAGMASAVVVGAALGGMYLLAR
jgi:hypothetical protein